MASFTKNGILINEQFGFFRRSINFQLLDLVSYLIKNINLKIPTDVIYLDLKKPLTRFLLEG